MPHTHQPCVFLLYNPPCTLQGADLPTETKLNAIGKDASFLEIYGGFEMSKKYFLSKRAMRGEHKRTFALGQPT
jgi:ssDNA-specific exonuclease RecJ